MKAQIIGNVIAVLVMFTVLFDPTGAALGMHFYEVGPAGQGFAEIVGNVLWVLGICYILITAMMLLIMFGPDGLETYAAKLTEQGKIKLHKPRWYRSIFTTIFGAFALIAIGSGFWFTGFFWLTGLLTLAALNPMVRKTDAYQAYIADATAFKS
jgi:hypothetical protein